MEKPGNKQIFSQITTARGLKYILIDIINCISYFKFACSQDSRKDELVEIRFDGKDFTEHKVEVPVKDVPEKNNGEKMAFGVYDEL